MVVGLAAGVVAGALALVPMPREVDLGAGAFAIRPSGRIVATSPMTALAASALGDDLRRLTGRPWPIVKRNPRPGDVVLRSPEKAGTTTGYRMRVSDRIEIMADNHLGLSAGSATAVQLLGGKNPIPRMTVVDRPRYPFRSVMVDVARKVHSIETLMQIVDLCRLYKVDSLHLHLSDDHLFMFPLKAFPNVGKGNREFTRFDPPTSSNLAPYRREDLVKLDAYAWKRGVAIIPEIDLPGHSTRLVEDQPEVFRATDANGATLDVSSPTAISACKTILLEVMGVFKHATYVHIGGDEVGMGGFEGLPRVVDAQNRWSARNAHDLYRRFLAEMARHVLANGRRPIVWESSAVADFDTPFPLPQKTTIMLWSLESDPGKFVEHGYDVVNGAWTPMYIVRNDKKSIDFMTRWSPDRMGFDLDSMSYRYQVGAGLLGSQLHSWENPDCSEIQSLRKRLAVMAEKTWTAGPIPNLAGRLAATDAIAERLIRDVSIEPMGRLVRDENSFEDPLALRLSSRFDKGVIRYTIDGSFPTHTSTAYTGPIRLVDSAWIQAATFDAKGRRLGRTSGAWFRSVPKFVVNLATKKPVTVENPEGGDPKVLVDGNMDAERHWAGRTPSAVTVDLESEFVVDRATLVTYSDRSRYYQFQIDVSTDGMTWTTVADAAENTQVASPNGYDRRFAPTRARYVRVRMLKNSANEGTHIVELMVFESKAAPTVIKKSLR